MNALIVLTTVLWAASIVLTLLGTWWFLRHFKAPSVLKSASGMAPLSILKPVKGLEEGAGENLESFFNLDYPEYELLFCAENKKDPVCALIARLMEKYPDVDAKLFTGSCEVGINPKVNNMMKGYTRAKYDLILISDSNVRVPGDYLSVLASQITPDTGILTAVIAGVHPREFGGMMESVYLNTFYARAMILTSKMGHPCVIGKSMLFNRKIAERFGGIQNLGTYLAEDYMAGRAMLHLNYRVRLSRAPVPQYVGTMKFRDFWKRHIRWGRIRKAQAPIPFFLEPLFGSIVSGVIGSFALSHLLTLSLFSIFAAHLSLWFVCDSLLMLRLRQRPHFLLPLIWIIRELTAVPLWVHTALGNTVSWRGRRLKILPGGVLHE